MKIRERINNAGSVSFALDFGTVGGRRKVRQFKTREEAEAVMRAVEKDRAKFGAMSSNLTPLEVADYLSARARLSACGASIHEAVEHYLKTAAVVREKVMVPELVRRFLNVKADQARAVRAQQSYRTALGAMGRWLAMKAADQVTPGDVDQWLASSGWAPKTRNARLGYASTLFNWARKQGLVTSNPCELVERARMVADEIGTLTLAECERLLRAAVGTRLLGYVVLGMFCGIRRAELERLTWADVNLEERTVIVGAKKSKTRSRRVVDIAENAVRWLGDEARSGRIVPHDFKDIWRAFREEQAQIMVWPNNALRHTFASMHYAMWQNEAKLQAQMGHESAGMLHKHYRALKPRAEAVMFWALMP